MGYTGAYSLAARCATEFLASATAIYLGEAVLANELLPSTKGHNLGFGWVAFGFGLSFYVALQLFGRVSAHVNPAMVLALWILDELGPRDFFAVSVCEVAGMMFGAALVTVHYWPHFKTLPEPPAAEEEEGLLRRRDALPEAARALAGYATRPDRTVPCIPIKNLSDLKSYLLPHYEGLDADASEVLDDYFAADPVHRLVRRRSIQVADLQAHLRTHHVNTTLRRRACPACQPDLCVVNPVIGADPADPNNLAQEFTDYDIPPNVDETAIAIPPSAKSCTSPFANQPPQDTPAVSDQAQKRAPKAMSASPMLETEKRRANALYAAAVTADQNAKLAIFATRPAIFHPLANFTTEFMCTTALILAALLLDDNSKSIPAALKPLYSRGLHSFLIGVIIVVMILGLGGPTGIAANPARDLGPRLAHWLLPIPGKGSSEFGYAWIPVVAPLCGGAAAGGLFKLIKPLFEV